MNEPLIHTYSGYNDVSDWMLAVINTVYDQLARHKQAALEPNKRILRFGRFAYTRV